MKKIDFKIPLTDSILEAEECLYCITAILAKARAEISKDNERMEAMSEYISFLEVLLEENHIKFDKANID